MKDTSTLISYDPKKKLLLKTINRRFEGYFVVLNNIEFKHGGYYKACVVAYAKSREDIRRKIEALHKAEQGFQATIFASTKSNRWDEETFVI